MTELLEAALRYAEQGLPIFPCRPMEKRPAGLLAPRGFQDATTDPETIRAWWGAEPEANIGLATGAAGLLVVDLDEGGEEALGEWELENSCFLATERVVRTPRGGQHLYLRGEAASAVRALPGVDIRSLGGYVLLPPSRTSEGSYALEAGGEPGAAPEPFLALLGSRSPRSTPERSERTERGMAPQRGELTAERSELDRLRAERWLQSEIRQGRVAVEGQGGDAHTYKTAAILRDYGVDMPTAFEMMSGAWNDACSPPWDAEELASKISNAYAYAREEEPGRFSDERSAAIQGLLEKAAADGIRDTPRPPAPARGRFTPLSWEEMQALPDLKWLLPGTLAEGGLSMIYGPPASYKSFISLSIALDIATGLDTMALGNTGEPRDVLYMAGEGVPGLRARAGAWIAARRAEGVDVDMSRFRVVPVMPSMMREADLAELVLDVSKAGVNPALIVVDTVARAAIGGDENSALDMGKFIRSVDTLREGWECHVLLVHHSGKAGGSARGSGSLTAAVDTELRVEAERGLASITMTKQKDAVGWAGARAYDMVQGEGSCYAVPSSVKAKSPPMSPEKAKAQKKALADMAEAHFLEVPEAVVSRTIEHLKALAEIEGALPISTAALARQISEADGKNAEPLREMLRRNWSLPEPLQKCVAVRDKRGRPTFYDYDQQRE